MFVFSHIFPVPWKSTFPMFWELYGFLLYLKYLRNLQFWNVCFPSYFFCNMGIRLSHVSASPKIFKKLITLECLCFPMLFPHYGNSVVPCFRKSTHFCFILSILGSPSLGCLSHLCLSHIFSEIWEFTSSILRKLPVFYPDYFKKSII